MNDVPFVIVSDDKDVAVPCSRILHIMEVNKELFDNGTLETHKVVGDDHELLTLLDDENSPQHNLYNKINEC